MKQIKRIVVGTDFSETAERAVDAAVDLAALVGATVSLVHAYELPMYSFPDSVVVSSPDVAQRITSFSRVMMGSVAERMVRTAVCPLLVIRGE
jgi:nucleotide-binding universal stress UspA family protein